MKTVSVNWRFLWCVIFAVPSVSWASGQAKSAASRVLPQNLHLIDRDASTGFEIYRASEPSAADMIRFCQLGITELMVLSGKGHRDEALARKHCPTLKVVFNEKTSARVALTTEFLADFDAWVMSSRAAGKKIAFRCYCGCHRTGRLAAYYQLRFMNWTTEAALQDMFEKGKFMFVYPELRAQVMALGQYIRGEACTQPAATCVRSPRQNVAFKVEELSTVF